MRAVAVVPVRRRHILPGGTEAIAEARDLIDSAAPFDAQPGRAIEPALDVVVVGAGALDVARRLASHLDELWAPATQARSAQPVMRVGAVDDGDAQPARLADRVAVWAAGADVVVVGGSADGRDLAVHLALDIDRPLVAGALVVRRDLVTVWSHGGRLQRDVEVTGPFVATIEPGVRTVPPALAGIASGPDTDTDTDSSVSAKSASGAGAAVSVESREPAAGVGSGDVSVVDLSAQRPDRAPIAEMRGVVALGEDDADPSTVDLAEADRLVGVGAGLMRPDPVASLAAIETIAAALGASVGATRVVTDAGLYPHDRQIGTTGVIVDPQLYIAVAISGAVQHTAGLGNPDHIVSINLDPHCPMMAMADLAVTSDANEVVAELARLLTVDAPAADTSGDDAGSGAAADTRDSLTVDSGADR